VLCVYLTEAHSERGGDGFVESPLFEQQFVAELSTGAAAQFTAARRTIQRAQTDTADQEIPQVTASHRTYELPVIALVIVLVIVVVMIMIILIVIVIITRVQSSLARGRIVVLSLLAAANAFVHHVRCAGTFAGSRYITMGRHMSPVKSAPYH